MAWQRKIPFGYQVQNGRINCHPEEAELVRAIFSRYLLGGSYSQIADEMTQQGVRYHQHTAQWNKHMVKRILENERYLGMDGYPQLVTDEEFLAVRLRRGGEQNTYAPCPSEIIPIRDKAVCASVEKRWHGIPNPMAAHAGGVKIQSAAAVYILMTASFWNECRSSKCWLILLSVSGFLKPPLPQQMPFASKMNWPSALTGPISTRNI